MSLSARILLSNALYFKFKQIKWGMDDALDTEITEIARHAFYRCRLLPSVVAIDVV